MTGLDIGGFTDISMVKRGGFATVYRARELATGTIVAIKVLDRPGDAGRRTEPKDWQSLTRLAGHPNVLRVSGRGQTVDGDAYLVLEFMAGGSLDGYVSHEGPMSAPDTAWAGDEILAALESAHQQGVLHRDVKPSNVLLGGGALKLADFGAAKLPDTTQTTVSQVASTISYAAPEVLREEVATVRSDLYSVGATLHFLFTGRPVVATMKEAMAALAGEPRSIELAGAPEPLAAFVNALLQPDPAARPASASDARALLAPMVPANPSPFLGRYVHATAVVGPDVAAGGSDETIAGPPPREDVTRIVPSPGPPKRRPVAKLASAALIGTAVVAGGIYVIHDRASSDSDTSATTTTITSVAPTTTSTPGSALTTTIDPGGSGGGGSNGGGGSSGGGGGSGGGSEGGGSSSGGGGGGSPETSIDVPTTPAPPTMPDVQGMTLVDARAALTDYGVSLEFTVIPRGDPNVGHVVATDPPAAGPIVDKKVTLTVAHPPTLWARPTSIHTEPAVDAAGISCGEPAEADGPEVYLSNFSLNGTTYTRAPAQLGVQTDGHGDAPLSKVFGNTEIAPLEDGSYPPLIVQGSVLDYDTPESSTLLATLSGTTLLPNKLESPIVFAGTGLFRGDERSSRCTKVVLYVQVGGP